MRYYVVGTIPHTQPSTGYGVPNQRRIFCEGQHPVTIKGRLVSNGHVFAVYKTYVTSIAKIRWCDDVLTINPIVDGLAVHSV